MLELKLDWSDFPIKLSVGTQSFLISRLDKTAINIAAFEQGKLINITQIVGKAKVIRKGRILTCVDIKVDEGK